MEDILTATSPEVLLTNTPGNVTNGSLVDYMDINTGENKFYLPVSGVVKPQLKNGTFCSLKPITCVVAQGSAVGP